MAANNTLNILTAEIHGPPHPSVRGSIYKHCSISVARASSGMVEYSYLYYCAASICYFAYLLTALIGDSGSRKTYIAGIVNLISVSIPLLMKSFKTSGVSLLENLAFWWFASFALAPSVFLGITSVRSANTEAEYTSAIFLFWIPFVLPNFLCVWLWRTIFGFTQFLTPWSGGEA